jgi:hypothetical protein
METMLQAVVIVSMLFLCLLCLFAVIVIVRDIIYESSKTRREREAERANEKTRSEREADRANAEAPVLALVAESAPVVETKVEEPVREEAIAPKKGGAEEVAATEDNPDAVSFSRVSLTMEEKYATLSTEFKRYFDDIIRHALSKEGVKESKQSGAYVYRIASYKVLKMMIKRSEIVCEFTFIDRAFLNYANTSGGEVKIKQSATAVRVTDASAVGVVKDGIDLVCTQIDADKEYKKKLAKEKRREKRRLAKEESNAN